MGAFENFCMADPTLDYYVTVDDPSSGLVNVRYQDGTPQVDIPIPANIELVDGSIIPERAGHGGSIICTDVSASFNYLTSTSFLTTKAIPNTTTPYLVFGWFYLNVPFSGEQEELGWANTVRAYQVFFGRQDDGEGFDVGLYGELGWSYPYLRMDHRIRYNGASVRAVTYGGVNGTENDRGFPNLYSDITSKATPHLFCIGNTGGGSDFAAAHYYIDGVRMYSLESVDTAWTGTQNMPIGTQMQFDFLSRDDAAIAAERRYMHIDGWGVFVNKAWDQTFIQSLYAAGLQTRYTDGNTYGDSVFGFSRRTGLPDAPKVAASGTYSLTQTVRAHQDDFAIITFDSANKYTVRPQSQLLPLWRTSLSSNRGGMSATATVFRLRTATVTATGAVDVILTKLRTAVATATGTMSAVKTKRPMPVMAGTGTVASERNIVLTASVTGTGSVTATYTFVP